MGERPTQDRPQRKRDPDERVALPLDPEEALRGLLKTGSGSGSGSGAEAVTDRTRDDSDSSERS